MSGHGASAELEGLLILGGVRHPWTAAWGDCAVPCARLAPDFTELVGTEQGLFVWCGQVGWYFWC